MNSLYILKTELKDLLTDKGCESLKGVRDELEDFDSTMNGFGVP